MLPPVSLAGNFTVSLFKFHDMKRYNLSAIISVFLLAAIIVPQFSAAQKKDSAKIAAVKEMVNNKSYTFRAQNLTPLGGRLRQLDNGYDLQVLPDKIVSNLPYFGRSYTAPLDPSKAGIQFTSTDFKYNSTAGKKGSWNVLIQTKDQQDSPQLQLTIFNDGTATLQVNSTSRQNISFNGYVSAPDKKP